MHLCCGGYALCTYVVEAMHLCCGGYALVFSDSNTTPGYATLLCPIPDMENIVLFPQPDCQS